MMKYHAITLVMRVYEKIADHVVDLVTMDRLTLDIVDYAKRGRASGKDRSSLSTEMVSVSFYSNIVYYLADFSVHFAILLYGYYKYVRDKRNKQLSGEGASDDEIHAGSIVLSCFRKTTLLAVSRGVELGLGSVGGGLGTYIRPGLGTLAGFNMGDSFAIGLTDKMVDISP